MAKEIILTVYRDDSDWEIYFSDVSIDAELNVCKFLLQTRQFFRVEYIMTDDGFRKPIIVVSTPSELTGQCESAEHYLREYTREYGYKFTKREFETKPQP